MKALREVLEGRRRWCVINADCQEVLSHLPDNSVACTIQDPPYSAHVHGKQWRALRSGGVREVDLGFAHLDLRTMAYVGAHVARVTERWALTFCDAESVGAWRLAMEPGHRHVRVGAWVKVNGQPQLTGDRPAVGFEALEISHGQRASWWAGGGHPAVWAIPVATDRGNTGARLHPTQKPLELMLRLVQQFADGPGERVFSGRKRRSADWPGDVVLDPFAGSGTTGVAALRLGRRCILVERDRAWARVARERLAAEEQMLDLRAARAGQLGLFA